MQSLDLPKNSMGKPTFCQLKNSYFQKRVAAIPHPSPPYFLVHTTVLSFAEDSVSIASGQKIRVSETGVLWGEAMVLAHNDAAENRCHKPPFKVQKCIKNYRACMLAFKEGYTFFIDEHFSSKKIVLRDIPPRLDCINHAVCHFYERCNETLGTAIQSVLPSHKQEKSTGASHPSAEPARSFVPPSKRQKQNKEAGSQASLPLAFHGACLSSPVVERASHPRPFAIGCDSLISSSFPSPLRPVPQRRILNSFKSGRSSQSQSMRGFELQVYSDCYPERPHSLAGISASIQSARAALADGKVVTASPLRVCVFPSGDEEGIDWSLGCTWNQRVFRLLSSLHDEAADPELKKSAALLNVKLIGSGKFNHVLCATEDTPPDAFPASLRPHLLDCVFRIPRTYASTNESDLYRSCELVFSEIESLLEAANGEFGVVVHAAVAVPERETTSRTNVKHLLYTVLQKGVCSVEERARSLFASIPDSASCVPQHCIEYLCELQNVVFNISCRGILFLDCKLSNFIECMGANLEGRIVTPRVCAIDLDPEFYRRISCSSEQAGNLPSWKTVLLFNLLLVSCFVKHAMPSACFEAWYRQRPALCPAPPVRLLVLKLKQTMQTQASRGSWLASMEWCKRGIFFDSDYRVLPEDVKTSNMVRKVIHHYFVHQPGIKREDPQPGDCWNKATSSFFLSKLHRGLSVLGVMNDYLESDSATIVSLHKSETEVAHAS